MDNKWLTVTPSSGKGDSELSNSATLHKGRKARVSSVVSYVRDIDSAKAYSVSQEPSSEYILLDNNEIFVEQEGGEVEITGKSNSPKLNFYSGVDNNIKISISEKYSINGYIYVNNNENIPNDIGAKKEFSFCMKISIPKNNFDVIQGKLYIEGSNVSVLKEVTIYQKSSSYLISYQKNEYISSLEKNSEEVEFGGTARNIANVFLDTEQYSYAFDGWYENGVKISSSKELIVSRISSKRTFLAKGIRSVRKYNLSFIISPIGSGTVSGGGSYVYNSRVRCYSTPKEGYRFIKFVDEDGVEYLENPTFFDIRKNREIQAIFLINKYQIALKNEYRIGESGSFIFGDIGGKVIGSGEYNHGSYVTVLASPNEGYKFVGWYEGSKMVSVKESFSFVATENRNISAKFQRKWFTITFVAGEGGFVEPTSDRVEYGGSTTSLATPSPGKYFQMWSNGSLSERINIFNVKNDSTYSASFGKKIYVINYLKGDGIESLSKDSEILEDGDVAKGSTATISEGYDFDGWYIGTSKVSSDLTYIPQNVTKSFDVTAKAKIRRFAVSADTYYRDGDNSGNYLYGSNGGSVTGSGEYDYGSTVRLSSVSNEGYEFVGWYNFEGDELSTENIYEILYVTQKIKVYARFQKKWFTVNYISGEGVEEFSKKSERIFYGGSVSSERIVVSQNYNSPSWKLTSGNAILNVSDLVANLLNVYSDCEVTASAVLNKYRITYQKNEFIKAIQKESEEVSHGGSANNVATLFSDTVQYSYSFDGWYDGDNKVSTSLTLDVPNITTNRLFIAKGIRTLKKYTITVTNGSGSGIYDYGENVTITANNIPGKVFTQWSDGVKTSSRVITVTEDKTYVAEYIETLYTIRYIAGEGILSLSRTSETLKYGENAKGCSASVKEGYLFDGWYNGSKKVSSSLTYAMENVTSDISLTAVAKITRMNISLQAYYRDTDGTGDYTFGTSGGTVSGGGEYDYGSSVRIIATPASGYKFDGWYNSEGVVISSSQDYTFSSIKESKTVYAKFTKKYYTVTYNKGSYISSVSRSSERVPHGGNANGSTMTIYSTTAQYSYSIDGWYDAGGTRLTSSGTYSPVNVTSDISVTAKATRTLRSYSISYTKGNYISSVSRSSESVNYGSNALGSTAAVLSDNAQYDYSFDGWYDGSSRISTSLTLKPTNVIVSKTYQARANRVVKSYSVSVSVDSYSSGKVSVSGGGTYNYGASVTVKAVKNSGTIFDGWYENGVKVSSSESFTFTVTGGRNLVAKVFYLDVNPTKLDFENSGGSKSIRVESSTGFTIS